MAIKVLDDSVINKIAAGEVIERPASIIKELIENSIDAKSTKIIVKVEDGGTGKIEIVDNGIGMSPEDIRICHLRHSTSKITEADDLYRLSTLGFRGEALASIAAVSILSIKSKTDNENHGTEIVIDEGNNPSETKVAINTGTVVTVKNLFYNTPARKKFLSSKETELRKIVDVISRYSLLYSKIHFKLIHDDKEIIDSPVSSDRENLQHIIPSDVSSKLLRLNNEDANLKMSGFISPPQVTRADKSMQSIFVNDRYVKSREIDEAIYQGYHSMLFTRRHPIFVIKFYINPKIIDVNVHPSKEVIKFSKNVELFEFITKSVLEVLRANDLSPEIEKQEFNKTLSGKIAEPIPKVYKKQRYGIVKESQNTLEASEEEHEIEEEVENFKLLGQINKEYIIIENEEGLHIVDQHAAQERTKYEKFIQQYKSLAIKKQALLDKKIVSLEPAKKIILEKYISVLEKIGIDIDRFGDNDYIIKTIPVIFGQIRPIEFLNDIIDTIGKGKSIPEDVVEEKIIRMSCRKSIKAGEELTTMQMKQVYSDLMKSTDPYTCPHGRPTIIRLTFDELEKKFKRI